MCVNEPLGADEALRLLSRAFEARSERVLLAVSGGPDSLALLVLAAENRARLGRQFVVATVDHGLRPEAAQEARAVARLTARCGLQHETLVWAREHVSGNLPAAARQARYRLLADAARAFGAGAVVTAHHQDDQIETHLMAAERGEGDRRLAGMQPVRDLEPGLLLLRPFLDVPKARLVASLEARGIPHASDPTNSDCRYARARWRERLTTLDPEGRMQLLFAIERAKAARDAIDGEVPAALEEVRVDAAGLVAAPRALFGGAGSLSSALLSRILSAAGGEAHPAPGPAVTRLAGRLGGDETSFAATLGGCRVVAEPDRIRVVREFGRTGPAPLDPRLGFCFDGRFDLDRDERPAGRLVALGTLGRGGWRDATLPVELGPEGLPVAAHPMALPRLGPSVRPLGLRERVSWRLRRDLFPAGDISQIAAKEPSQVGKDFPADYLHARRMERSTIGAMARSIEAQSQDER